MLEQPFVGGQCFLQGLRLLTKPGIKRFVVIPLLINVAVFSILFTVLVGQIDALIGWMTPALPSWLSWLSSLLWLIFAVLAAVLLFFSFSILANIIAAPFNGLLAEAVEHYLTGQAPPPGSGLKEALRQAPAAILDELRKVLYYVVWAVPVLILFLIPGINLLAPFAWVLFSAWMLAVQYCDFPLGNQGLTFAEQRQRLKKRRWLSYGFGGMTLLATLLPGLNFLVMPAAVAGATVMTTRHLNR